MYFVSMLFLFTSQIGFTQNITVQKSHSINPIAIANSPVPTTGTLNVIGIMVEFEPDSNRLTSGTGIFGPGGLPYMENASNITIDPLPHDKNYFEAHLEFSKNYFEKSSRGQLTINYKVLPQVYRLDKKMEEYSPTGETFTYEKIAYLIRDAWNKVEEMGGFDATGLNPDETAFIIFHAGIGRDIDLTGTTLDITPLDIPSLYLGKQSIGDLLEDPSFNGISVNNGTFRITNSMIIPRTESRRGLDIQDNEFVFPLSINGLLTASIGSHLGLPDLFNTSNGESGIGRFGLMDGASFFSYHGLFPPEPSAWEKIYLGWETPFLITTNTPDSIALPAASLDAPNSIAKFEISSTEYFLIENRHRDINGTGVTVTIRKPDGTLIQQSFDNKNEQFVYQTNGFDTLFVAGVLVDVDNFDWSLPGGYDIGKDNKEDTADDRFLNGGILIWHIDEAVLQNSIENNTVNNNLARRGVVLKEADGAQDIGKPIPFSSDNTAAFGTPFDFWWQGNDYRVITPNTTISLYKNEFSPTSTPNNNSNSGATSYFRFYDFSDNLPTAYFKVESISPENSPTLTHSISLNEQSIFSPYLATSKAYPLALAKAPGTNLNTFVLPYSEGVYFFYPSSNIVSKVGSGEMQQPYVGQSIYLTENLEATNQLNILPYKLESNKWVSKPSFTIPSNTGLLSSQNGDTIAVDGSRFGIVNQTMQVLPNFRSQPVQESKRMGAYFAQNFTNTIEFPSTNGTVPNYSKPASSVRSYTGVVELANGTFGYFILEDNQLIFVNPSIDNPFKVLHSGGNIDWPAIVDFNNDGDLDFIYVDYSKNHINGVNSNGGMLGNFPFSLSNSEVITGTPLVADVNGDGDLDLIVATQSLYDVNLRIFKNDGSEFDFSPLYVGGVSDASAKVINPIISENSIFAVSQTGELRGWQFDDLENAVWAYKYGNEANNKVVARLPNTQPNPLSFNILNAGETYNWPNPADAQTNLRFQLERPGGSVEVNIISLSGNMIYKNTFQSAGGPAEEVIIDTSSWPSGGYYAMVKATVNGRSESKLVKIAVAH